MLDVTQVVDNWGEYLQELSIKVYRAEDDASHETKVRLSQSKIVVIRAPKK